MSEVIRHPTIADVGAAQEHTDLEPSLATARVDVRLSGTVLGTGANDDAAVYQDHLMRMMEHYVTVDGDLDFTDGFVSVRNLYDYHRLMVSEVVPRDELDPSLLTGGGTDTFDVTYSFWFARPYLIPFQGEDGPMVVPVFAPAFDDVWAKSPSSFFRIFHQLDQGTQTAASDPGTAAIFSAGTDDYTFSVGPNIEVAQVVFQQTQRPALLPFYQTFADQYDAANGNLDLPWPSTEAFDLAILKQLEGADRDLETGDPPPLNRIQLGGTSRKTRFLDEDIWHAEMVAVHEFLAYNGIGLTVANEGSPGTFPLPVAKGDRSEGRGLDLTERVVPGDFGSGLRFTLDTDAPTSTPGEHEVFQAAYQSRDGVTQL